MARRYCPVCKKVVEEKLIKEGKRVTKVCPECGHVFISYEIGKGIIESGGGNKFEERTVLK
ncbi:MAG: hypothetical protein ASUL_02639 [Candidatus Aramenus sulfurataquae]|uniref:Uncharacterized protein n=2 Tax=Candidatus Aramenus sulfurataquae TaxID=1326980 RepID=W7KKJ7_9CREN|nr:MAG: hypothetical protein ASUL_02639 [Candidatus Aramenus sulfurataquae]MCL7344888.1 hypothetical protein [Candidatus Aramenus sulfurataquae]